MRVYCHHSSCITDTLLELSFLMRRHTREECVRVYTTTLKGPVRCRHVPRDPRIPLPPLKGDNHA